ncbi:hypothetical protein AHAS_Ahas10G0104000 [Arachis hypogaea]
MGFKHTSPQIGSEGKHDQEWAACILEQEPHTVRPEACDGGGPSRNVFDEVLEGGANIIDEGRSQPSRVALPSEVGVTPDGVGVRWGMGHRESYAEPERLRDNHAVDGGPSSLALDAVLLEGCTDSLAGTNCRTGGDREPVIAGTDQDRGKAGIYVTGDLGVAVLQSDGGGLGLAEPPVVEDVGTRETMDELGDEEGVDAANGAGSEMSETTRAENMEENRK